MENLEDLYITLLRYGRDHLENGVTYTEVRAHLEKNGFNFRDNNNYKDKHLRRLFPSLFFSPGSSPNAPVDHDPIMDHSEGVRRHLRTEAYFQLLEYEELNEARASSRKAHWTAIFAIIISIIAMGFSVYYSHLQLTTPSHVIIDTPRTNRANR